MPDIVDKIRPCYQELKGRLSQLPLPNDINKNRLANYQPASDFNMLVEELNRITNEDFNRFLFPPGFLVPSSSPGPAIPDTLSILRMNMNGLIMHLHGKFYPNTPEPFSAQPQTVNQLIANQEQNLTVEFKTELRNFIDQQLKELPDDSPKKPFFQKLRDDLGKIDNWAKLINSIFSIAHQCGFC